MSKFDFVKFKKIIFKYAVILIFLSVLPGCGPAKTSKLARMAKKDYGPATVVSNSYQDDCSSVLLKDKAQGFEYTMYDNYYAETLDGSEFGFKHSHYSCNFEQRLADYVFGQSKNEIDAICYKYNSHWKPATSGVWYDGIRLIIYVNDRIYSENVGVECAEVLQNYNKKGRLDDSIVSIVDAYDNTYLGTVNVKTGIYEKFN